MDSYFVNFFIFVTQLPTYGIFASELPVHEGPATRLLHHLRSAHGRLYIYARSTSNTSNKSYTSNKSNTSNTS